VTVAFGRIAGWLGRIPGDVREERGALVFNKRRTLE
jgi:hypothetical protein